MQAPPLHDHAQYMLLEILAQLSKMVGPAMHVTASLGSVSRVERCPSRL